MGPLPRHKSAAVTRWLIVILMMLGALIAPTAASATVEPGDSVHIGARQGYSGTGIFPVWYKNPAVGEPDAWAYCIEHDVHANSNIDGHVGGFNEYLGTNHFTDPTIQGRVLWVLAHGYPAKTIADLEAATGIAGLSVNDAIEATQYAIWRYTDLDWDASWNWESQNSETVYWYLVNGANTNPVMTPSEVEVTASITAPSSTQTSDSIVGPFVVNTNQKSVGVSAPSFTFTDASGSPIDPTAVVDGQEIYLDLRGHAAAGATTVTVTASAPGPTGRLISVPRTVGSMPTSTDHAQSIVLVQAKTATVGASANVAWTERAVSKPVIGTSLVDSADGDRVLSWNGGTVIDTIA
ncbi:thioester domain-containing protein, partial [Arthrobacter sp. GMC3]|uniref:thioester domain-containing protein n=1 Tax=Arthrobacter sp. GMC3 TaxID=2058894 RepID=UPI0011B0A1AF